MQPPTTLYVDHAATTPMWPEARLAMEPFLDEAFFNASSLYGGARGARKAIEDARDTLAAAMGARPEEVVFTSGGTEADNMALTGAFLRRRHEGRDGIIVSAIEHHAVLDTAEWLGRQGARVQVVGAGKDGVVDLDALAGAVDARTAIVSVMAANNETGVIQPIARAAEIARASGALFHTDAVQALPWLALRAADADLWSFSAHKLGGPKGVGALVRRRGVGIEPILHGGGQERGLRSGTYNVAGIAGFGAAVRMTAERREEFGPRVRALRDRLQERVSAIGGVHVVAAGSERLPGHCNMCIEGIESEPLLLLLDAAGIAASSGSACQSGATEPSHVLLAMGMRKELAQGALRLTLGRDATGADVDAVVDAVTAAVGKLRA